MGDEQQQCALRRLFEHLPQGIGTRTVEILDRIDNGARPASLARSRATKWDCAPNGPDRDLVTQHAFLVDRTFDHEEVRLRLGGDPPGDRIGRRDLERFRAQHSRRERVWLRKNETRQTVGQRCLADAFWPANEHAVRHAAGAVSTKQRRFRGNMAEETVRGPRMRCLVDILIVIHFATSSNSARGYTFAAAPSSTRWTVGG